jgi:cell division protein ZapA
MKQLEVEIMGQNYLLSCPDGGDARLLGAVERVDTAMCKIRESGKVRARDRIAVLAAINLAFDLADPSPVITVHESTDPVPDTLPSRLVPELRSASRDDVMRSLLERLDAALGEDGRLI